jgi:hypothetical protein
MQFGCCTHSRVYCPDCHSQNLALEPYPSADEVHRQDHGAHGGDDRGEASESDLHRRVG